MLALLMLLAAAAATFRLPDYADLRRAHFRYFHSPRRFRDFR
jgi:hypothetical protein